MSLPHAFHKLTCSVAVPIPLHVHPHTRPCHKRYRAIPAHALFRGDPSPPGIVVANVPVPDPPVVFVRVVSDSDFLGQYFRDKKPFYVH